MLILTMSPTSKVVMVNGVPARIWEGRTSGGVEVHAFVTRVCVSEKYPAEVHARFRKALQETKKPSADVEGYPLRLIL